MRLSLFVSAAAFSIVSVANPLERRAGNKFCSSISQSSCHETATNYCASYLGTPRPTSYSTVTVRSGTTTTSAGATSTTTANGGLSCRFPTTAAGATKVKRALSKPTCLSAFTAAAQLSSACHCLHPESATVTATTTTTGYRATKTVGSVATVTPTYIPGRFMIYADSGFYAVQPTQEAAVQFTAADKSGGTAFGIQPGSLWLLFPDYYSMVPGGGTQPDVALEKDGVGDYVRHGTYAEASLAQSSGYHPVNCTIIVQSDSTCHLSCFDQGKTDSYVCTASSAWLLSDGAATEADCSAVNLYAVN